MSAYAQKTITGKITDKKGIPIPFAAVVAQQLPDSTILQTQLADTFGSYSITVPEIKNVLLRAMAGSYRPSLKLASTGGDAHTIDFQLADDSLELKEVTVRSQRPLIERKADRIIFNVESSISSIGGDALDAIKKAPGVRVSAADDISIVGKSTVTVMIDDRMVQLTGEELAEVLSSMPSDNIARIEVITTPPAKYDANGNGGIINIVTKKFKKTGFNGDVTGSYNQNTLGSPFIEGMFNYRKSKFNLFGNFSYGDDFLQPLLHHTSFYPGEMWRETNRQTSNYTYGRGQVGMDYNVTPKAVIGFIYTYGASAPKLTENVTGNWVNTINSSIDSVIRTNALTRDKGQRNVLNLNYEWHIDTTGKKLNIDADYFTRTGTKVKDFTTDDFLADGTSTGVALTDRTTGTQVINISSVKFDVDWPVKLAHFAFGGKITYINDISDNLFQTLNSGAFVTDPAKSDNFKYTENTSALYASVQKALKKWEFQAGLRGEYTQTQAISITLNQTTPSNYFKLFPTAYLLYKIDEDHVLNLNYSRRTERPDFTVLNPFRSYTTANSYEVGNPFLQPSYSSNLELGYTIKSKYTFTLFTQQVQNYFTQVLIVDTVNQGLYFDKANIGKIAAYGFTANVSQTVTKWWETNVQFSGFYAAMNSAFYNGDNPAKYERPSFTFTTNNSFYLNRKKSFLGEINFTYDARHLDDFDIESSTYELTAGIKALFADRRLILALSGQDILAGDRFVLHNLYNGSLTNSYYGFRSIKLAVTWKFGNRKVTSKRERAIGVEEETGRVK